MESKPCNNPNPVIMHRTGGISASVLNYCGTCGNYLGPDGKNWWKHITEKEAKAIRIRDKEPK